MNLKSELATLRRDIQKLEAKRSLLVAKAHAKLRAAFNPGAMPGNPTRAEMAKRMGKSPAYLSDLLLGNREWNTTLIGLFEDAIPHE